ncbi:hypothetical protein ACS3SW_08915 [Roseobacteraceae bacterium S113]
MLLFFMMVGALSGFVSGLVGWAAFDMSVLAAFGLYMSASLAGMTLGITLNLIGIPRSPNAPNLAAPKPV